MDCVCTVRNKQSEVEAFTKILETFERMSGQSVNLEKYLNLPILIGKKKSATFKSILDRAANRINNWSKRLLSNGGKKIFIKSILQSIPTYAFSVFFVPNGVLEKLQFMICRVWWGER
ncbi:uncharacterized protein LOC128036192 [Gossypium raimondii]|uniref:uncharacterized protein LOC128036192 n=1 Tax=Gossypium raimondii TaxID=29730 RepID=UPI00227CF207|nr:uncharacterized protein LOC128036192 [Gossypium raimondii]